MHLFCLVLSYTDMVQSCVDIVNVQQRGANESLVGYQVIVPEYNFSCNGRITGYLISLDLKVDTNDSAGYPSIQIWRPTNQGSTVYSMVGSACALTTDAVTNVTGNDGPYHLGNVSCTENNRTEFQSGDVIGYYQDDSLHYQLWNNATIGYTSYGIMNSSLTRINISSADHIFESMQPLIQVIYGKIKF